MLKLSDPQTGLWGERLAVFKFCSKAVLVGRSELIFKQLGIQFASLKITQSLAQKEGEGRDSFEISLSMLGSRREAHPPVVCTPALT